MAKKPYDVTERFQEVARRARETGPIHTGPKKKPAAPVDQPKTFVGGTGKKDVNLPIDTGPKQLRPLYSDKEVSPALVKQRDYFRKQKK